MSLFDMAYYFDVNRKLKHGTIIATTKEKVMMDDGNWYSKDQIFEKFEDTNIELLRKFEEERRSENI